MDSSQIIQENLQENCLKLIKAIKLNCYQLESQILLEKKDKTKLWEHIGALDKTEKALLKISYLLQHMASIGEE